MKQQLAITKEKQTAELQAHTRTFMNQMNDKTSSKGTAVKQMTKQQT